MRLCINVICVQYEYSIVMKWKNSQIHRLWPNSDVFVPFQRCFDQKLGACCSHEFTHKGESNEILTDFLPTDCVAWNSSVIFQHGPCCVTHSQRFTNAYIPSKKIPLTVCIITHAPAVALHHRIGKTVLEFPWGPSNIIVIRSEFRKVLRMRHLKWVSFIDTTWEAHGLASSWFNKTVVLSTLQLLIWWLISDDW
jgi:hypothetical protein